LSPSNSRDTKTSLSIVIASFNSAPWLPSTLASLADALSVASWDAEVIVVDDGSTDDTASVLEHVQRQFPVPLKVVSQENMGRFFARWEGVQAGTHETVLLLDSRLIVHEDSLSYLQGAIERDPGARVWNGHVITDPEAPLVGHFWSVPTHVFWSEYLARPRPMDITVQNFDRVPKGTGFLLIPKELFVAACRDAWPTKNAHLTSDDTKLLRYVVNQTPIRLDPGFAATYRPRVTVRQFLAHSWGRGTLFVDSYAGTGAARNMVLVALALTPPLAALGLAWAAVVGQLPIGLGILAIGVVGLVIPAIIALIRRCPPRAVISYLLYVVPFGAVFWAGLVRGLKLHRKAFIRRAHNQKGLNI
jgi:hypothetical protein